MVIDVQIGKLHRGEGIRPPALPDSEKPSMFRIKASFNYCSSGDGNNFLIPVKCDVPEEKF